jgi:hypothetical protein
MKTSSKLWLAAGLAAALVTVAGCSDSNDDNTTTSGNPGAATVPDSAGTTVASFMAYLIGLDANDEKSEPLLIKDSFAVPADEGNDPLPVV